MNVSCKKVFLVDDDLQLGSLVVEPLRAFGYDVQYTSSAFGLESVISNFRPDILFLDIDLKQKESGVGICGRLHQKFPDLHMVLISSISDPEIREQGIRNGAKLFIGKPLTASLLDVYIRLLLGEAEADLWVDAKEFASMCFLPEKRLLRFTDEDIETLTRQESLVLDCLVQKFGDVVSYEELHTALWGNTGRYSDDRIYNIIKNFRYLFVEHRVPVRLRTIRGAGYALESDNPA